MKKTRIVGFALTLAATMVVGGAMGQTYVADTYSANYVEVKSGTAADENVVSLVQISKAHGFFAIPDGAFHPTYASDGKLTKDFQWKWTVSTGGADATGAGTKTATGAAGKENYVELTFNKAQKYIVDVSEIAPSAWGGCFDVRQFTVHAFDAPSFEATTASDAKPTCMSTADLLKNAHFKLFSSGTPYVKYKIVRTVMTIAADGTLAESTVPADKTNFVAEGAAEQFTGNNWTWNNAIAESAAGPLALDGIRVKLTTPLDTTGHKLAEYDLEIAKKITKPTGAERIVKYSFVVTGINGLLSRKADYVPATGALKASGFDYYNTVTATKSGSVDFLVSVAPKTGPVYHIGNNVAK
ncbi:hypothetical protein [uncultured Acetobacteroides sp.]|uniref:hypothetical protein n=1 Tax=uncultured Acetobacteroides sp. TaxID=1760811 RepID=UPI0029F4C81F|nr:hypothetical protein [uncultured Acetobacteroides sp.]